NYARPHAGNQCARGARVYGTGHHRTRVVTQRRRDDANPKLRPRRLQVAGSIGLKMLYAHRILCCVLSVFFVCAASYALDERQTALAAELHDKGWILYSAKSDNGTWDLFVMRPDGSDARNLTNTADIEEAAPRFSPNSDRILYRAL